jgi:hypothetical protein
MSRKRRGSVDRKSVFCDLSELLFDQRSDSCMQSCCIHGVHAGGLALCHAGAMGSLDSVLDLNLNLCVRPDATVSRRVPLHLQE